MKTKHYLLITMAMFMVATSCRNKSVKSEINEQIVCVKAVVPVETTANVPIECSGLLSSKRVSKLSFKTGGIIARMLVEEGSNVKKGQLLAALNMTEIAALAHQSKVAFEKADRDLKRVRNLYGDTVATLEQLQNATSAYDAALENQKIAEFNLKYSCIEAPANGKIIGKLSEIDELVAPGMPVLIFSEQGEDEWIIKAGVSDKDIVVIQQSDKVEVEFDAFQGKKFQGTVTRTSEGANAASGTFEIEITVNPSNAKFINGLVAKVKIRTVNTQMVTMIPPDAITEADNNKGFVYIAETNHSIAKKVPVTIAYVQSDGIAVFEPLKKAGLIITKGAAYVEDGSKINIIK